METAYLHLLLSWRRSSWVHPASLTTLSSSPGAAGPAELLLRNQQGGGGDCRCQQIGENKGPAPQPGSPGAQVGPGEPTWGKQLPHAHMQAPKTALLLHAHVCGAPVFSRLYSKHFPSTTPVPTPNTLPNRSCELPILQRPTEVWRVKPRPAAGRKKALFAAKSRKIAQNLAKSR